MIARDSGAAWRAPPACNASASRGGDRHQPIGIGEGQWLQQDSVDEAEDRGVGPDPKRQRGDDREGECRALRQ